MMIRTTPIYFFFNDTPTTEIYTLSLHDALPIYPRSLSAPAQQGYPGRRDAFGVAQQPAVRRRDRSAAAGGRRRHPGGAFHRQGLFDQPGGRVDDDAAPQGQVDPAGLGAGRPDERH